MFLHPLDYEYTPLMLPKVRDAPLRDKRIQEVYHEYSNIRQGQVL